MLSASNYRTIKQRLLACCFVALMGSLFGEASKAQPYARSFVQSPSQTRNVYQSSSQQPANQQPWGQASSAVSQTPAQQASLHQGQLQQTSASQPEAIHWGSHGLAIPYRWAGNAGTSGASVVALYVSLNQGVNWQKVASASPQVHSFKYQAASDGEYWFAIRTYDRQGGYLPVGPLQPEMRVLVDTTSPQNPQVKAELRDGMLVAQVLASDSVGIDRKTLRLYAQLPNQPSWNPVPLEPLASPSGPGQASAIGRWRLPAGVTYVAIRASVADLAGNRSETNLQASSQLASSQPLYGRPNSSQPQSQFASLPLTGPSTGSLTTPPAGATRQFVKDPFLATPTNQPWASAQAATTANQALVSQSEPASGLGNSGLAWGASQSSPNASGVASNAFAASPSSPSQPWPVENARTKRFASQPQASSKGGELRPQFRSAGFGAHESQRQRAAASSQGFGSSSFGSSTGDSLSAQGTARFVDSRNFEFDYEVDKSGQWGVAKVELWGTTDGGRSWRRFAIDSDRISPVHVTVPSEGDYGFKILVESVGGFEPTPPRPGDRPEVTVRVDQTSPRITIQRAEQGEGYQADRLNIQWHMVEEHPVDQPMNLYYSNRKSGPWIPLATSIDNSGRYSWRIQRHLPNQLYLRIEARDQAGNLGSAVTDGAISISIPQASGSLRSVRTVPSRGY